MHFSLKQGVIGYFDHICTPFYCAYYFLFSFTDTNGGVYSIFIIVNLRYTAGCRSIPDYTERSAGNLGQFLFGN